jgi:hypothetical protein
MHYYFIAVLAVAGWLFKSGKLNFIVKKGMQKAYSSLFKSSEDFEDFVQVKVGKEQADIETGSYFYKADSGVLKTFSYLDFTLDFSLSFNNEKKTIKQSVFLTKGSVRHKFTIEGAFEIQGQVVRFTPTEGDLMILPEDLRDTVISFIVAPHEKGLLVSFNEDQFGESNALLFETH